MSNVSRDHVENKLRLCLSEQMGMNPSSINMDDLIDSTGMDSLDLLEIIMTMEDDLGVELPDHIFSDSILDVNGAKISEMIDAIMKVV